MNGTLPVGILGYPQEGRLRYFYQFLRKDANSMISKLTDNDLATPTVVKTCLNSNRLDMGTCSQDHFAANRPEIFVTVQNGANTTYRYLGQLAIHL